MCCGGGGGGGGYEAANTMSLFFFLLLEDTPYHGISTNYQEKSVVACVVSLQRIGNRVGLLILYYRETWNSYKCRKYLYR